MSLLDVSKRKGILSANYQYDTDTKTLHRTIDGWVSVVLTGEQEKALFNGTLDTYALEWE